MTIRVCILGLSAALLAACGTDPGGHCLTQPAPQSACSPTDDQTSSSGIYEEPTPSPPTTGDGSISGAGTSDGSIGGISTTGANTTVDSSTSGAGTSDGNIVGSNTTGESSSTQTSLATTGQDHDAAPCSDATDAADCMARECHLVLARKFVTDSANWCLNKTPEYLACASADMGCSGALTVCTGKQKWFLEDECTPPDATPCAPPPDAGGDGYQEC